MTEKDVGFAFLLFFGLILMLGLGGIFGNALFLGIIIGVGIIFELYYFVKMLYYIYLSHTGIETTAVLVAVDIETRCEKYRPEYNVYAPIMRYKTEQGQIIQARYHVFTEDFDYERNFDYPICYIPSKPELFYFTEYPSEFSSDVKKNLLRYSVGFMMSIIYMFLTV